LHSEYVKQVDTEGHDTSLCGIRPCNIRPKWVTVPLMYCMTKARQRIARSVQWHETKVTNYESKN